MSNPVKMRLLKLLALRERGIGGEARNAGFVLERLLRENNMTEADLVDGEFKRDVEFFSYRTKHEKKLLIQILASVLDDWCGVSYSMRGKSGRIGFKLTKPEFAEVTLLFSVYRQDLKKTIEQSVRAFIQANRIFRKNDDAAPEELSEDDLQILRMAAGIKPSALPHGQLGMRKEVGQAAGIRKQAEGRDV